MQLLELVDDRPEHPCEVRRHEIALPRLWTGNRFHDRLDHGRQLARPALDTSAQRLVIPPRRILVVAALSELYPQVPGHPGVEGTRQHRADANTERPRLDVEGG